jgi:hypothetical protein
MLPMEEKLTPQEAQLIGEGNAMLNALAAQKKAEGASSILGPDGLPAEAHATVDPKTAMENARKAQEDVNKLRLNELQERMKELTTHDGHTLDMTAILLACHRMIFWAKSELYAHAGAEEDLVDFMDRWMRETAMSKPFTLRDAIAGMKHQALDMAERRHKELEAQKGARLLKLKRLAKGLDATGLRLPTKGLSQKLENHFRPGDVIVLHGTDTTALQTVTSWIATRQLRFTAGRVHLLEYTPPDPMTEFTLLTDAKAREASDRAGNGRNPDVVKMALPWWRDAASHIKKLYETLEPIVKDECALVVIENLDALYFPDPTDKPLMLRKQQALVRLYQWAREHVVAVVVADLLAPGTLDTRLYGHFPVGAVDTKEVDGVSVVTIDGETCAIEQEEH